MLQSKRNPDMYLLYFELLIHPTNFILKNGIKHPAKAMLTFKGQTSSLDKISHLDELVKILKFSPFFHKFSVFLDFLRIKNIQMTTLTLLKFQKKCSKSPKKLGLLSELKYKNTFLSSSPSRPVRSLTHLLPVPILGGRVCQKLKFFLGHPGYHKSLT